ncbi:MAG TPA: hydrogenase 2 operon protein HybA [Verrucomicrobiae bacterium]|nr:hydrogenase 2 operon protein HybA [Verrucomicrobiae bacterium]
MNRRSALKMLVSGAAATAVAATGSDARAATDKPPGDVVGMLYDATLCVGCKACVAACAKANGLDPDTSWSSGLYQAPVSLNARTKNIIKLYREGSEQSYVKSQCMHCLDPACASACMLGALSKDERGIVWWNGDLCVGCRYCQVACPYDVPKFEWNSPTPKIVKCELCRGRLDEGDLPACVDVCPRNAVIFGTRSELLKEAHRRLERYPDLYIQKVFGENDGGGTQVLYISHVDFGKLGLPDLGDRPVAENVRMVQRNIYWGFAAPVAAYAALAVVVRRNIKHAKAGSNDETRTQEGDVIDEHSTN